MMSFQAHPEIHPHRPILSVIQRCHYVNPVFPYGIVRTDVPRTVIIFSHHVQSVQRLVPETISRTLETVVHADSHTVVIVEIQAVKLDHRGMYAQGSPLLEGEMFGGGQIEAGQVVGILSHVVKGDVSAA